MKLTPVQELVSTYNWLTQLDLSRQ